MKKKQAISLIVLVITIIVMFILAGAIVLTLNNSGIIGRASGAVRQTNLSTVKELASLGWAEAYANGARTVEELQEGIEKILVANNIDTEKYGIIVTTSGVKVAVGWIQDGLIVKRGTTVLTIGDEFEYDETAEGTKDVEWKVLGASENGELLIMSASDIVSNHLLGDDSYSNDLEEAQNDWLDVVAKLDGLCLPYGTGKGATGARSITVEDVNKITGYDPETAKYGVGKKYEYGNIVTYTYNGTTEPSYSGSNGVSGELSDAHSNGFHFYNGTEFVKVDDLTTGTIGTTFATLKSDSYSYKASDLGVIDIESKAYTMLFETR